MADPNAPVLTAGSRFLGRYEVVRAIKSGAMGTIYEVIHLETKRRRALKVMLPSVVSNPELRARFKLEATIVADIESEHIVETFDAGVDPESGSPFLVMELLRGDDLGTLVAKRGRLPGAEVAMLLGQAALALDKTHAAGIVHRDLKPENLFITCRDDGSPRLKVLDFGIAKVVSESAQTSQQTAALGTPLFMAPEQIKGVGNIGPRADLYSLGHIAYTLLSGEAYWLDDARKVPAMYALLLMVVDGATEPASARAARRGVTLPAGFDAWFARATAPLPEQRFASASAMVQALGSLLGAAVAPAAAAPQHAPAAAAPQHAPAPAAPPPQTVAMSAAPAVAPAPPARGALPLHTVAMESSPVAHLPHGPARWAPPAVPVAAPLPVQAPPVAPLQGPGAVAAPYPVAAAMPLAAASTHGAVSTSPPSPPRRSLLPIVLGGAIVVALGLAFAAFRLVSSAPAGPTSPASSGPHAEIPSAAPAPTPPSEAPSPSSAPSPAVPTPSEAPPAAKGRPPTVPPAKLPPTAKDAPRPPHKTPSPVGTGMF
jgi:serine/threonine-protein kinase